MWLVSWFGCHGDGDVTPPCASLLMPDAPSPLTITVLLCMACARPLSRRLTMADVDPAHPLCQLCKAAKEYDADIQPGRTIHIVE
jgi:hypothetical protein